MAVTFDSLVADIPDRLYAQNRTLVDEMPDLIRLAQEQIILRLDHDLFQTVVTGLSITRGDQTLDLSNIDRLLEPRAVRLSWRGGMIPLERRDLEMLTILYPMPRPGQPRYYAEYGNIDQLRVFPSPRENYTVEVTANVAPPILTETQQTNVIATEYPRLMEMAVARQAAIFMKNQADEQRYAAEMTSSLEEANAAIARRRRDETGTRPMETTNAAGS